MKDILYLIYFASVFALSVILGFSNVNAGDKMQIGLFNSMNGVYRPDIEQTPKTTLSSQMAYYLKAMGYTHVIYFLATPNDNPDVFQLNGGGNWIYNTGDYNRHGIASSLKQMRYLIEDTLGMTLIPAVPALSNCSNYIRVIPEMSEIQFPNKFVLIQTRDASRDLEDEGIDDFAVKDDHLTVYVAHDVTLREHRPPWLKEDGWKKLQDDKKDLVISADDKTIKFHLYAKEFFRGETVVLGRNHSSSNPELDSHMYFAALASTKSHDAVATKIVGQGAKQVVHDWNTFNWQIYSDAAFTLDQPGRGSSQVTTDIRAIIAFRQFAHSDVARNALSNDKWEKFKNNPIKANKIVGLNSKAAKQIFREYMKIINAVYGPQKPEWIHLGSDELGFKELLLAGADQSQEFVANSGGIRQAIANFLDDRIGIVHSEVDPSLQILLWGDSFIPTDWGDPEKYDLCGDVNDGTDGVLDRLIQNGRSQSVFAIMPWNYEDHAKRHWSDAFENSKSYNYNKETIAKYFSNQQIRFLPAAADGPGGLGRLENNTKCLLEWHQIMHQYDQYCIGLAMTNWVASFETILARVTAGSWLTADAPEDLEAGSLFPINAHLWDYPAIVQYATGYNGSLFAGVDFAKARNTISFDKGDEYTIGLATREIGDASDITARWDNGYTQYTLGGQSSNASATEDNCLYAFMPRGDNFTVSTRVLTTSISEKVGIMIRNSLEPGSKCVFLHFNTQATDNAIHVHHRDSPGAHTVETGSVLPNNGPGVYMTIRRNGPTIRAYGSTDGQNYQQLATLTFEEGLNFVGFANFVSDSGTGSATFGEIDIRSQDLTPIINLLLFD